MRRGKKISDRDIWSCNGSYRARRAFSCVAAQYRLRVCVAGDMAASAMVRIAAENPSAGLRVRLGHIPATAPSQAGTLRVGLGRMGRIPATGRTVSAAGCARVSIRWPRNTVPVRLEPVSAEHRLGASTRSAEPRLGRPARSPISASDPGAPSGGDRCSRRNACQWAPSGRRPRRWTGRRPGSGSGPAAATVTSVALRGSWPLPAAAASLSCRRRPPRRPVLAGPDASKRSCRDSKYHFFCL